MTAASRSVRNVLAPGHNARPFLLIAGVVTSIASLLHLAIIWGGPSWYQFFGAGDRMARLAARGSTYPAMVTTGIAAILGLWAMYAFSGAGFIRRLPLLRLALWLIAAVSLARGILGIPVVLTFDGPYMQQLRGRMLFMAVSSAICVALGLCYAIGAGALPRGREGGRL